MDWYHNIKISQQQILEQKGFTPDVINYIMNLPPQNRGKITSYLLSNPNANFDINSIKNIPINKENKNIYTKEEFFLTETSLHDPVFRKWALVQMRKNRTTIKRLSPDISYNYRNNFIDNFVHEMPNIIDWRNQNNIDIASYEVETAIQKSREWHQALLERNTEGKFYLEGDESIVYGPHWEDKEFEGWTIRQIKTKNDLEVEGEKVGHCVGGYYNQIVSKDIRVFSLRDPNNTPYVTIETEGDSWKFLQIFGNGPKTGNAEPYHKYQQMIGEWMQGLKGVNINNVLDTEENPYLEDLATNQVLPSDVEDFLEKAIDWYPENGYGIEVNDNININDFYDAVITSLSNVHNNEIFPRHARGIGKTLALASIYSDLNKIEFGEDGGWEYEELSNSAAELVAKDEFNEKFKTKIYDKKYHKGWDWKWKSDELKEEAKNLISQFDRNRDGYEYISMDRYIKHRGKEIVKEIKNDKNLDEIVFNKIMNIIKYRSSVEDLINRIEDENEKFMDNYDFYTDEIYPQEQDYNSDEEFNKAVSEYEEKQNEEFDYTRKNYGQTVIVDEIYDTIKEYFAEQKVRLPDWFYKYPIKDGPAIMHFIKQKQVEINASINNWYKIAKFAAFNLIPTMRARDFLKFITRLGFVEDRRGKHNTWIGQYPPYKGMQLHIPIHSPGEELSQGLISGFLRQLNINHKDFNKMYHSKSRKFYFSPQNIKTAQYGEFWIDELGNIMYADGDIGENNHEGYVINQILSSYDFPIETVDINDPEFIRNFVSDNFEETIGVILKQERISPDFAKIALSHPDKYMDEIVDIANSTDLLLIQGASDQEIDIVNGNIDARDYAIKQWGWKRLAGNDIETNFITSNDLKVIAEGLYNAYDESATNLLYDIYVYANRNFFTQVPFKDIEKGNPLKIREYQFIN